MWLSFVLVVSLVSLGRSLDNGLGRTPPMGWNDWERYRCNVDCKTYPDHCISANLFKSVADLFVKEGYKDVGYEYVNMDDCWPTKQRDAKGRLQADPERFPEGIKGLADYIHSKGLKLGIYEDFGTHTCAGYPGSEYYLEMDAQTFAEWEVDYLKLDGCYSNPDTYKDGYPPLAFFLNQTGRPIFLSTEYPVHQLAAGMKPNYKDLATTCNMARNFNDMQDSWDSVITTIEFYAQDKYGFAEVAGPGFWNDPDMLIVGNFGLSRDQERVHMAMWCMMASPLLISTDLRYVRPYSKFLLQNRGAIAINQDPMGVQAKRINQKGNIQVWTRPIVPEGSFAFTFLNAGSDGTPNKVSIALQDLGFNSTNGYKVTEVFNGTAIGTFHPKDIFTALVNPTGIFFGKAVRL